MKSFSLLWKNKSILEKLNQSIFNKLNFSLFCTDYWKDVNSFNFETKMLEISDHKKS
jgi:hypothetical protein